MIQYQIKYFLAHYTTRLIIIVDEGTFSEFDWGPKVNMLKYGYRVPALYNSSANIAPTVLFHSENDILADPVVTH